MNTPRLVVNRIAAVCRRATRSSGTARFSMEPSIESMTSKFEPARLVGGSRGAIRFRWVQGSIARRIDCAGLRAMGEGIVSSTPVETPIQSSAASFLAGLAASFHSVFALVLIGTYVGIGALAHDYGFSLAWVMLSTMLVWAGPAQVIMITALGTGAPLLEVALAV